MKSITLHNIDGPLAELIKSKPKSEGLSMNKTIQKILEESLGVRPKRGGAFRKDFEEFCGIWSDRELAEFNKRTDDLNRVDPKDWR
ncbi:MAG: hypothetical protein K9M96_18790 [Deltaproteobacteria bacterium]|nr:hypothetical protein [Deltaproteobacteria bacterium]MCF8120004.1 hypothetical protein [Deltaproteobacteria bacterium]